MLLNIWLVNIFVAVIINTFGNIREETKHSAFAGKSSTPLLAESDVNGQTKKRRLQKQQEIWRNMVAKSSYLWIALVVVDIGMQASKTAEDSLDRIRLLSESSSIDTALVLNSLCVDNLELYFTLAFLVEIVLRCMSYLPDWRAFKKSNSNIADALLAVITCCIQIPVVRNSAVYPWLTVFQLMRFYRVILAVPRMRKLIAKLLTSVTGLINMVVFLLLMNFLAAIIVRALLVCQTRSYLTLD